MVKRILLPLYTHTHTHIHTHTHTSYPPYILPHFRGAKYSSNLVTLPSVRWGLFIRGVSRLSFIVDALSFLPFPFISFPLLPSCMFLLSLSLSASSSLSLSPRDTNYIPALTYSGLMPAVLPSPNLLFAAPNITYQLLSSLSVLVYPIYIYIYIPSLSLSSFFLFSDIRRFAGAV